MKLFVAILFKIIFLVFLIAVFNSNTKGQNWEEINIATLKTDTFQTTQEFDVFYYGNAPVSVWHVYMYCIEQTGFSDNYVFAYQRETLLFSSGNEASTRIYRKLICIKNENSCGFKKEE